MLIDRKIELILDRQVKLNKDF